MIGLSTIEASTNAPVVFEEAAQTQLRQAGPRASRVATLDGGCVVVHGGAPNCDRAFFISATLTESQAEALWALYAAETVLHLSCADGYFSGYINDIKIDNGDLSMTFYVKEKLSS